MRYRSSPPHASGFTLVEVLVVIAIIGILANISTPMLLRQIEKARAVQIVEEYRVLGDAYQRYAAEHGQTPAAWFAAEAHPDFATYIRPGTITYANADRTFFKYLLISASGSAGGSDTSDDGQGKKKKKDKGNNKNKDKPKDNNKDKSKNQNKGNNSFQDDDGSTPSQVDDSYGSGLLLYQPAGQSRVLERVAEILGDRAVVLGEGRLVFLVFP